MPSKGKAKGNGWEREVAASLTELYGEPFVRVPNSGAFIGGKNAHRKSNLSEEQIRGFKGDIIPGPSFPKLNIEGKFYADFPFHQLIQGSCKQLDLWLDQLLTSADDGDVNILAMKFNRKGKFLAFQDHHLGTFHTGSSYIRYHNTNTNHGSWTVVDFDDFWRLNNIAVQRLSAKDNVVG